MKCIQNLLMMAICFIAVTLSAQTKEITFVMEDKEDFPNVMGNGTDINWSKPGVAVELLKMVEKKLGLTFKFKRQPWKRCLQVELKDGTADGAFPASYKKEREEFGAYPTKGGKVDDSRRYSTINYAFYKLKGANIQWDGKELKNFSGVVGAPLGYSIVEDLRGKGLKVEEATSVASMKKMVLGRVQLVATLEMTGDQIMDTEPEVKGKVEKVVPLITSKNYHIMLSHQFVKANPELAEKIWNAIGELREKELPKILKKYLD